MSYSFLFRANNTSVVVLGTQRGTFRLRCYGALGFQTALDDARTAWSS